MNAVVTAPPLAEGAPSAAAAGLAVSCRNLQVRFFTERRAITALQGLSLEVPVGEFLTLLGPSGCGKSTFLRVVADSDSAQQRRDPCLRLRRLRRRA